MKKLTYVFMCAAFLAAACQSPKEDADYASRAPIPTTPGDDVAITITEERFMSPPVEGETDERPTVIKDWNAIEMMEYKVGPGDVLSIAVYVSTEVQSYDISVQRDGKITLPLIGVLDVLGKKPEEIQAEIQEKYSTYYIMPSVHLTVREYKYHHVYVMGLGINQMDITLKKRTSLFELVNGIGQGQGGLVSVDLRGAYIQRGKNIFPIDLKKLMEGDLSFNYEMQDNDILFLRSLKELKIFLLGEINRPGVMTMENDDNLFYALARAGGPTPRAQTSDVRIIRGGLSNPTLITVDISVLYKRRAPRTLNTEDLTRLSISANASRKNNLALEKLYLQNEDFIYVPKTALAAWNDIIREISPTLSFMFSTPVTITRDTLLLSNAFSGN